MSDSRRTEVLVGYAAALAGAFIIALYAGLIPTRPVARCRAVFCDPHHWQLLCFGIGFAGAGMSLVLKPSPALAKACGIAAALGMLAGLLGTAAYVYNAR